MTASVVTLARKPSVSNSDMAALARWAPVAERYGFQVATDEDGALVSFTDDCEPYVAINFLAIPGTPSAYLLQPDRLGRWLLADATDRTRSFAGLAEALEAVCPTVPAPAHKLA